MRRDRTVSFKNSIYFKISLLAVAIISILCVYFISINNKVSKWDKLIYPGVFVDGIDLSGKTKAESRKIIEDNYLNEVGNKEINIEINDISVTYHYSDIDAKYDVDKMVNSAFEYGKKSGLFMKNRIIEGKEENVHITGFEYDKDKLKVLEEKIINDTMTEPEDAKISINNGQIHITL